MGNFGWLYQVDLVMELEGINRDQVFNMDVINFLSNLVYIKNKSDFLKTINGTSKGL